MAIRVALTHTSRYRYDRPVSLQPHLVRLRPAPHCRTPILSYSMVVTPAEHFLNWQQDPFGNYQARLAFPKPTRELVVEVDLVAEMIAINPFDFFIEDSAETYPFRYEASLARELAPYMTHTPPTPKFGALIEELHGRYARAGRRNVDVLVDINREISQRLRYDLRMEPGVFEPEETLERGHGSCRDFSWLQVELLRRLGYAARFVSGYSIQLKPDVKPLDGGPAGVAEDVADLHAWTEVYLPGAGWIGLDATSGLLAGEGHIPLAATAWPLTAAPITGAFAWDAAGEDDRVHEETTFALRVTRIQEEARVTKPYRDDQWTAINALGERVDRDLERFDVRLTMGGEPTFVSIDDRDAPEWNIAALGEGKRRLADKLARRLRARFAPGGLLHHGQGKWYPGELLPRWAYSCYFRRDGQPIWGDPALFAEEPTSRADRVAARGFAAALAQRLGLPEERALPAFEDAFYYLWRERRLPINVNVVESRLDDPVERARLARVFGAGLNEVVGYVLPLRVQQGWDEEIAWESGRWSLRDGHLFLLPGDSPMGFRLPLDSLPWESEGARVGVYERDPLAARKPLGPVIRNTGPGPRAAEPKPDLTTEPELAGVVRTAVCVEARDNVLHVFMPPLGRLEEYLALVTAVEDVARERAQPIRFEGYHPPSDHRLERLSVTPDPGVIEVNVHPVRTWTDLTENTRALYEEARLCRLGTEKFMLDGRHTGTGGGNHFAMGGPTPADSPFLRRPDLLRSLVGYFTNHPSLSYLFSGLFVGPTSQAPRLDEARQDSVHELEIAFGEVRREGPTPPWLVDRIFRNLLVDVTGNTHRAEICIDKLYSPDSASGRQGLVELRAFEMPPHADMSLTQQLLLRSMVAWFWRAPYAKRPVRWGTGLVDRFTLPHFVMQDFEDVLDDLRNAGYPFATDWFRAHRDFRFPLAGEVATDGVTLELRTAIEPWHVLGEEPGAGGTVRYVDSSVERLEVKARGMIESRHVLACGGRRVPLHPTGSPGEAVAGVRFRAWQQSSALHPTVGVHAPLVFDLIDTWTGRAIGGCTYHVSHPGGLAHEHLPANALEAEGRRIARFFPFGHTPGPQEAPPEERNPDFPLTLDLRRPAPVR
ncbi:MAG TPA: transglutaminase family protein [Polyangia bacterium]|nr:transglutaminase family protein [Polyangia bacterium]